MRNQRKQANQISSLCAPLCLSSGIQRNSLPEKAGRPSRNKPFSVYRVSIYALCVQTKRHFAVLNQIPTGSPGLQKILHKCCSFFIWIQEKIYAISLPGRRQTGTDTQASLTLSPSARPRIPKGSPRDKWPEPSRFTVMHHYNNCGKEVLGAAGSTTLFSPSFTPLKRALV